ncbi:MAG TPA: Flp pilus assembly protein CpaB [Bryobacterales bacterium]|nr:Flp pilus assembly protein CpaB [Bryobacterales bacterium]
MKKKLLPLLGIAFVVAVISTGIFYGLIVGKLSSVGSGRQRPAIVVAARSLERGAVLDKSEVKLLSWPSSDPPPKDAFTDPDQVAGLTVLQPVNDGEPLTAAGLSSRDAAAGAPSIPPGMRAVSIRVADSPGVLAMLHAGHRVDVQVVRNRNGASGPEAELHTVLQDVQVLAVPGDPSNRSTGPAVVTLLATPSEADALGVADSGAHLRLLLRNPADRRKEPLPSLTLAALFRPASVSAAPPVLRAAARPGPPSTQPEPATTTPASAAPGDVQVELRVRLAAASPAAISELSTRLVDPERSGLLHVAAFRPGWNLEQAMHGFESRRLLDVLVSSSLLTGNHREVSMQAGAHWTASPQGGAGTAGLRIQFAPSLGPHGKLRVRVQPEITCSAGDGVASRRIETEVELADGQSFLITGLGAPGQPGASLIAQLFPGRAEAGAEQELVVLATPQLRLPSAAGRRSAAVLNKR